MRRHVAFDCAWWGRASLANGEHRVHCSFAYELPEDIDERLNLTDRGNVVARRVVKDPGRTHYFSRADLHSQPSTAALTDHMGIAQSLCIADLDVASGISNFISLARRRATPRFSAADMGLLELLAPHLSAALDMALADQLTALRNPEKTMLMATDSMGSLRVAEPGSLDLLRGEWPGWAGPLLPAPLVARIAARQPDYLGRHLHAGIRWAGDNVFLAMRRREPRDLLTRQERAVATAFAAGQSYRQVADELGLAPATVRHHLRSAYVKLDVSDKAAFALRLGGG
ncbi:MAG: helix-turn-helix transcriptional regulator [Burkholderiales bacterium]|nr:helix-turn-helix transcriptional regulator [Burkholderiales bacterium]